MTTDQTFPRQKEFFPQDNIIQKAHKNFDQETFDKLPDYAQSLLELISIIYAPVAATPLASCAHRVGINDPQNGESYTMHSLRPLLVDLIHKGWLEGSKGRYYCPAVFSEKYLLNSIRKRHFNDFSKQVLKSFGATESFGRVLWQSTEHGISHARIYLFQGQVEKLVHTLDLLRERYQYRESILSDPGFYPATFGMPPNQELLDVLDAETFSFAFMELAYTGLDKLQDISELWQTLDKRIDELPNPQGFLFYTQELQCSYSILSGRNDLFPAQPEETDLRQYRWFVSDAFKRLTQGNRESSIQAFENATAMYRKLHKKRKGTVINLETPLQKFQILALLADVANGNKKNLAEAHKLLNKFKDYDDTDLKILGAYAETLQTGIFHFNAPLQILKQSYFSIIFYCLVKYWLGQNLSDGVIEILETQYEVAKQGKYQWLVAEYATALAHFAETEDEKQQFAKKAAQLHQNMGTKTLFELIQPQSEWERALNAMNQLADGDKKANQENNTEERIIWVLDTNHYGEYFITPKLQKISANGKWSKGRNIALKRLKREQKELPPLSKQDHELVSAIFEQPDYDQYYHRGPQFRLDMNAAWPKLVGHPNLYWEGARSTPIELVQSEFELLVSEDGENLRISFYPPFDNSQEDSQFLVVKETPSRLCLYPKNEQVMRLSEIISNGLTIPREAEKNLRETLSTLAPMISIQSDLEGVVDAKVVEADPRIHANLLPYGEGLRATLRVKPFGEFGAYFPPGHGRAKLSVLHEEQRYTTTRDLDKEKQLLDSLLQHSPILGDEEEFDDEYLLDDPQSCLELLEQLNAEGDNVLIAWPEGEVMRIASRFDTNNLRLSINKSGDWFQLEGSVSTDPSLVLSLRQLLDLTDGKKGRFVEIGEGQFLSLTSQFRKKLDSIRRYAELSGEGAKISALASLALEDFTDMVGELTVDEAWKKHIHNIQALEDFQPELPSTLQTELREYQLKGFQWLSRLAKWGVGACLADDMGLGKTIQTLAILLERASLGATLVVAPTSVSNNWESEIRKFAPTLKPLFYREHDREKLLNDASKFDVIITSYGLLQQDSDMFIDKHWSTIVLDEAQAIKNVNAKRTRTAHQLQGDYKIVTTGTPIENHLGELWSLFRFLNPGLLGTQQQFMQNFISPIEKDNDPDARAHLKKLIQPFILRRTKTQVLDELPPKTEITLEIPLSEGERSLYEAVRSKAMDSIAQSQKAGAGNAPQGNHLKVLAAITKLRLASCHPKLVMEDSTLSSSKLDRFGELVEELLENNHKALVFSQFVKHLAIIRQYLDKKGISYQYLDGSTPVGQRKTRVDEFQDGKGDLFLISLKAGGSGLNLTAADYVIHMDPWWNPAVEDQASDRAHRIGQTRPVTIYRLVAENTIEQKIVKLHQHKRDLADGLLEGSDMSGSMSADEMLAMIRES